MKIKSLIFYVLILLNISCNCQEKKIEYFENGKVKVERYECNDIVDGEYKEYSYNGTLLNSSTFDMGILNGKSYSYYQNGQILSISEFNHGKLININAWDIDSNQVIVDGTGVMLTYNTNGAKLSRVEYKNNKPHGEWINYFDEGMVLSKMYYNEGERVGKWEFFEKDGTLVKTEEYGNMR